MIHTSVGSLASNTVGKVVKSLIRSTSKQSLKLMVTKSSNSWDVLGVEHLLRDSWHRQCAVLLGPARRERRKARHKELEPREGNEVDRMLPQIAIQMDWESDARRHPR